MELLWISAVLVLLFFGVVVFRGAPYVPTHKKQVETALDMLNLKPGEVLIDLGSGDGVLLKAAAKRGIVAYGYELNPLLCVISYVRCWSYRKLVKIKWGDFWLKPLPVDTKGIFTFLASPYMKRLAKKVEKEGARPLKLVSYGFEVPGFALAESREGLNLYKLV